jgi:hypothetical protein
VRDRTSRSRWDLGGLGFSSGVQGIGRLLVHRAARLRSS